jgi:hypothetical protein
VKHSQITILALILLFIVALILLNISGITEFDSTELIGYGLIFYGIATVYTSFGEKNKFLIFIGSVIFLSGILISLPTHFDFIRPMNIFIPSSVLITGISLFIVYFDDTNNKTILFASIILTIAGIIFIIAARQIQIVIFGESIIKIIGVYWPVLLVICGITILLKR